MTGGRAEGPAGGVAAGAVEELVGVGVTGVHGIGASVFEVDLDGGGVVVAKFHAAEGKAGVEAHGLRWLAEPGAVAVPEVRGVDGHWLVIDQVEPGAPSAAAAAELGRGLARLHAAGAGAFGEGPRESWIGNLPMACVVGQRWPEWFAEHRIRPYLRLAVDRRALSPAQAAPVEAVCARIEEVAGPAEPPARLHGDLWNGNVLWDRHDRPWLIDPAAHGGHRESDLAMLALFGCPHLDRVLAAYDEAAPLAAGWRDRVALHQLFPLLVHVVLFGAGYAGQTAAAARRVLAT
ncbi:fructosamine kinase family protein [Actinokineospora spheciospongiae]|uniref:fructosamine kinase family protein n=1 Tax=Actinokineospora spheciospongiae TaxID=909613 RepID=UPI000D71B57B|nr:fructosamine-3-kinase [Actinokineospora spheciospongiae]